MILMIAPACLTGAVGYCPYSRRSEYSASYCRAYSCLLYGFIACDVSMPDGRDPSSVIGGCLVSDAREGDA